MSRLSDFRKTYGPSDILRWNNALATTSGDNTIIAAVTGKKIRVLSFYMSPASAVNLKWTSSTTSDLTKLFYMANASIPVVFPMNEAGWFETVAGELLGANLSGSVIVSTGGLYITI